MILNFSGSDFGEDVFIKLRFWWNWTFQAQILMKLNFSGSDFDEIVFFRLRLYAIVFSGSFLVSSAMYFGQILSKYWARGKVLEKRSEIFFSSSGLLERTLERGKFSKRRLRREKPRKISDPSKVGMYYVIFTYCACI